MWIINARYGEPDFYQTLARELDALTDGEPNLVANLANVSSWIYHALPDLNWCGFYIWDPAAGELVLGPFQGKPACLRIRPERGVCGEAYRSGATVRVDDVYAFPGHIACDAASRSELVIPLKRGTALTAVLDLDSPTPGRFSERDAAELTKITERLATRLFPSP
jgi:L-methionine (R)-S-oxide reductase